MRTTTTMRTKRTMRRAAPRRRAALRAQGRFRHVGLTVVCQACAESSCWRWPIASMLDV